MTPPDSLQAATPPRSRTTTPRVLIALVMLTALGGAVWLRLRPPPLPESVSRSEFDQLRQQLATQSGRSPGSDEVLYRLGEKAGGDGRLETALDCFRVVSSGRTERALPARLQESQVLLRLNRVREAETGFRDFLSHAVGNPEVRREDLRDGWKWLTYLLSVELRLEDRKPELMKVHSAGLADVFDSKQLYFPHLLIWASVTGQHPLEKYLEHAPRDTPLLTALARYKIYDGRLEEARALLEQLHQQIPQDADILAVLLECHFEANDWPALSSAAVALPEPKEDEPWLLMRMRGELALHQKNWEGAVQAFQRLLKVDPANPWAHMGLAKAYGELGQAADRERALDRSLVLSRIRVALSNVTETDPQAALELADDCQKIEFHQAADTFRQHALRIQQNVASRVQENR